MLDHLAQAVGDARLRVLRCDELPALARARERAAGEEMIDHHREEERIARGDPLEGRRRVGRRLAREPRTQIGADGVIRQQTERQLVTLPPHDELLAQRRDRMPVHDRIDGSVGGDEE